jgi:signal transduction histidine kinase
MTVPSRFLSALAILSLAMLNGSASAEPMSKDDAVAMVKKAVALIQDEGPDKAYPEISDKSGPFVQGAFYIAVVGMDGTLLAYGADFDKVGDNLINLKDEDGKEVVKERIELARKEPSFWQSYKFKNPETDTVQPKEMYCERLDETVVCGGIYD